MLLSNGFIYPGQAEGREAILLAFEINLLKLQLHMEDTMLAIGQSEAPLLGSSESDIILLLDRGALDIKAYAPADMWESILTACSTSDDQLMSRYDVICHLHSTAKGAEEHYSLESNEARTEGVERARELDDLVLQSWQQHPNHHIFANGHGKCFADKMDELLCKLECYFQTIRSIV